MSLAAGTKLGLLRDDRRRSAPGGWARSTAPATRAWPRGRDQGPARRAPGRRGPAPALRAGGPAASALNHPHIVTIHEIESADGIDFIVMELVPGQTLDALIPRQGMRLGEALRLAIPIADALAAAHARGIVHRDLKPANVMVTRGRRRQGARLRPGQARHADGDGGREDDDRRATRRATLSRPGTVAGTPAYMSPEQARAARSTRAATSSASARCSTRWSTGRRAFAGSSSAETLAARPEGAAEAAERARARACRRSWSGSSCAACARSPAGASSTWPT